LNPMSPYALHKLIGEQYCTLWSKLYGIDTVSLRYFNVYGNRMSLDGAYRLAIPIFASQINEGIPCAINNDGNQRRDYTYVEDVINANILAATSSIIFNGEAYNVGNGNNVSINELVDMMGGEKSYGNKVIEPFETLASYAKIDLDLEWKPTGDLQKWIINYMENLNA
jgi:UDP-glucose 4-epimerase